MLPLIEEKRAEVAERCRRKQVRRLEIFGSATRDDFDSSRSDLDFLVEFEPKSPVRSVQAGIDRSRQLLYAA